MDVQNGQTLDELIDAFSLHLRRTRGTHLDDCANNARYARSFIEHVCGSESSVDVAVFTAPDVIAFMESIVGRYQPTTLRHVSTALRSFFRFLRFQGLRDDRLDEVVPGVVHRRFTGLPRHLDTDQLERFIAGLDRSTPCGLRDRAMILCIARLGLRASEVVRLCLEDIDWRDAVIHVHTRKTGRGALLPLVAEVGEALFEYIEEGRPTTMCRNVFVLHHLRVGEPTTQKTVYDVVKTAIDRTGVEAPTRGPNLLRHTLATSLIRSGASLKEIADLLGHRRLETTQIYAKLDLESLREVAQPWPEVAS
jgi:integrase/recombinase XerD